MVRKVARNAAAAVCLLVGIAGLFLPVIQGIALIVLAVLIADFQAKERLLERYRHTRLGGILWERHQARRRAEAARNGIEPESAPAPPPRGEAAGGDDPA